MNNINIIWQGRVEYQNTKEYRQKVSAIKKDITDKYKLLISSEKNIFSVALLRIKMKIEIRHEIKKITSKSLWAMKSKP